MEWAAFGGKLKAEVFLWEEVSRGAAAVPRGLFCAHLFGGNSGCIPLGFSLGVNQGTELKGGR